VLDSDVNESTNYLNKLSNNKKFHTIISDFNVKCLVSGWHLRFVLGPSLHASTVRLFCNHPRNKEEAFERTTYYELEWRSTSGSKSDSHDIYAEIKIVIAGSFNYYFTIDNR